MWFRYWEYKEKHLIKKKFLKQGFYSSVAYTGDETKKAIS